MSTILYGIYLNFMLRKVCQLFIFIALLSCFTTSHAQRQLISDYEEVVKRANAEIDASMQTGFLHEMEIKYGIKGEYVIDITVYEKGKVLSVFVVSSDAEDIKQQNLVKDIVKQLEFNFKLPKGKNYKFERTFKFV